MADNTNPGNFANRPKEEVQNIASKGGQASSGSFEPGSAKASEAGKKGGQKSSGSFEPGSDKAREAGQKGGSR
ncbi:conidiation-specific protein 10 [Trichoderma gamsii]|uniref:Conidiation-specific protein 10 n=1 Tax=Trichoderma gamsii TaxID=398673 RepID=A0A0W7VMI2_9HYPO|nr:conidiation-specific protein 10 [Trichoderma gamsii]PNP48049.1 hypothetical protein TGAMA5MH_00706 [Trichoderma gamsii]PON31009.1 conidiation-specific protein 10 [Trichoderma gamsii]